MATRANIIVREDETAPDHSEQPVVIYRHWDGYPGEVLPKIAKAFGAGIALLLKEQKRRGGIASGIGPEMWKLGRATTVAALICSTDPLYFEPEGDSGLHSDVDWVYVVSVSRSRPRWWTVSVYRPLPAFLKRPKLENAVQVAEFSDLAQAVQMARQDPFGDVLFAAPEFEHAWTQGKEK